MSRIFLADDHPMIQSALDALLRGGGHEIVGFATSGVEALEQIPGSAAEVLVLDVMMPGGSGIHVLSELRGRGDPRPVVLLTAAIADEKLRSALSLGVSGIVLKKSDPILMIESINEVGRGERWIDEAVRERAAVVSAGGRQRALSDRERELIQLVRQGLKNREIAERLGTTEGTVKAYLHAIFDKVGVENRTELAMKAAEIIGPD